MFYLQWSSWFYWVG